MRRTYRLLWALVLASHPWPVLTVTVISAGLAVSSGRDAGGVAGLTAAVLAGQLSVGWLNDLVDAGRDARTGRAGKPVADGRLPPRVAAAGVVGAAVAALALTLLSGPEATAAHAVALASAWSYNLGVKGTVLSPVPYAVSFGLLPAVAVLGLPGAPLPPPWLVAAGALLGCAAHVVNVLPDLADDAATGVRGLPHRLGATVSTAVAVALVLATAALLTLAPPEPPSLLRQLALPLAAGILAAGLVHTSRTPGSRALFHAVLTTAVLNAALLLTAGTPVGR